MTDALYNALKRKKEIEIELEEIEEFLRLHSKFVGTNRDILDTLPLCRNRTNSTDETQLLRRLRNLALRSSEKPRGRPADFASIIEHILNDLGRPLRRGELVEQIEQRAVKIPSGDKERYVGTIIWRNRERFVSLQDLGYWLKDRPCSMARYTPGLPYGVVSDEDGPDSRAS
jgi:hypothetical protein